MLIKICILYYVNKYYVNKYYVNIIRQTGTLYIMLTIVCQPNYGYFFTLIMLCILNYVNSYRINLWNSSPAFSVQEPNSGRFGVSAQKPGSSAKP